MRNSRTGVMFRVYRVFSRSLSGREGSKRVGIIRVGVVRIAMGLQRRWRIRAARHSAGYDVEVLYDYCEG